MKAVLEKTIEELEATYNVPSIKQVEKDVRNYEARTA